MVFSLACSSSAWCTENGAETLSENSRSALVRLSEISNRLGELNETLRRELIRSKLNSDESVRLLESSRSELSKLKLELEASRKLSIELSLRAELSETESLALKAELKKAESSSLSLEASFGDYRTATEKRLRSLERSARIGRLFGTIASAFAVSGWAAFLLVVLL